MGRRCVVSIGLGNPTLRGARATEPRNGAIQTATTLNGLARRAIRIPPNFAVIACVPVDGSGGALLDGGDAGEHLVGGAGVAEHDAREGHDVLDFHVAGAGVGARDGEREQIRLAGGEAGVAGARVAIDGELPRVKFETDILLGRLVVQGAGPPVER